MIRHLKTIGPALAILAACLASCSNDIDLFDNRQEKTWVVFGLLNSTDSLQQVKVRMTSVTDAPVTEIVRDSSEFSAPAGITVELQEWQRDYYSVYRLEPVTYSRNPGLFMNTRNDIHQVSLKPSLDMQYKLIISDPATGEAIYSRIEPVPAPKLGSPNWPWIRYTFSDAADPFNIRFYEVPRSYVYLVRFTIRYIDVLAGGDTVFRDASFLLRPRFVDNPPGYSPVRDNIGPEHNQYMTMKYTYNVFDLIIPEVTGLDFRQLICFEVSVWAGDRNLRNYMEFGIKFSDNRKQSFTNIVNGIGFFGACAHSDCTGVLPDQKFMDSLPLYSRTARLKFRTDLYRPPGLLPSIRQWPDPLTLKSFVNEE